MELNEQMRIAATRDRVFAALNDPAILRDAIPGCDTFEARSPTEFVATVTSKIGPMVARFNGSVRLSDVVPGERFTLTGDGKAGPVGFAKVVAQVTLEDDGAATLMTYRVKADIGGKLGQLGGGMIERTAKKLSGEFFAKLEEIIAPPAITLLESGQEVDPGTSLLVPEASSPMSSERNRARLLPISLAVLAGIVVIAALMLRR